MAPCIFPGGNFVEKRTKFDRAVLVLTVLFVLCAGVLLAVRLRSGGEWLVQTEREDGGGVSVGTEETGWPDSLLPGEVLDLNTASAADLERLPGIGAGRAADIVAYRQEHGGFQSVDELDAVGGIGSATLESLRPYVTVSGGEN